MDRKVIIGMCVSAVLFACCTGKPKKAAVEEQEDLKAKEMFQGIWLSDDTEIPLMRYCLLCRSAKCSGGF